MIRHDIALFISVCCACSSFELWKWMTDSDFDSGEDATEQTCLILNNMSNTRSNTTGDYDSGGETAPATTSLGEVPPVAIQDPHSSGQASANDSSTVSQVLLFLTDYMCVLYPVFYIIFIPFFLVTFFLCDYQIVTYTKGRKGLVFCCLLLNFHINTLSFMV